MYEKSEIFQLDETLFEGKRRELVALGNKCLENYWNAIDLYKGRVKFLEEKIENLSEALYPTISEDDEPLLVAEEDLPFNKNGDI